MPVASAQVKSALILAGLQAEGETRITEPLKTRDHTENMIRAMGGEICLSGDEIILTGKQRLKPLNITVPGDFSSAAYFLAASASAEGWVGEAEIDRCQRHADRFSGDHELDGCPDNSG